MSDLVKTETTALATTPARMSARVIDMRDIILPKILLMQGLSTAVSDGKAVMGEMRDSLESRLLGTKDAPLEVIPFFIAKSWIIYELEKGKLEYKTQVGYSAANANWTWDEKDSNGVVKVRRDQSLNVYCLLPNEIEEGMFMPYMLSFRRTSYTAGRKIVTAEAKLNMFKRALWSKTFKIFSEKTENDLGTFYKFDAVQGRDTTKAEQEAVQPWLDMLSSSDAEVRVDDRDLAEDVHVATAATGVAGGGIAF